MAGTEKLLHAYLIASPSEEARDGFARELAAAMVCSGAKDAACGRCRDCRKALHGLHPDIIYIRRETDDKGAKKRDLGVMQIRAVTADAALRPNEAARKVYIFPEADAMNPPAQNALLKTLEEPPEHAAFILCAANPSALLPTVRSRCAEMSVPPGAETPKGGGDGAAFVELAENGGEADIFAFCRQRGGMSVQEAAEFCGGAMEACAAKMAEGRRLMELYELLARCEKYLRVNTGVRHIMGLLAVKTIEMRNA